MSESERKAGLVLLEPTAIKECQSSFDTTGLALADMEQANIAYGRRYLKLEVPAEGFATAGAPPSTPVPGDPAARRVPVIGGSESAGDLGRLGGRSLAGLRMSRTFVPRDETADTPRRAMMRMMEGDDPGRGSSEPPPPPPPPPLPPLYPIVKAISFGIREIVGWVPVPPGGVMAEPPPDVAPGLYLVERYRLASYARGFGLGDHLYSFTLFPEEEVEIEIKTWKSREQIDRTGSSIFDGQSDTAESDFAKSVEQENARTSKKDKASEAHVEASAEAGWGFGSAEVSGGASTSSAESVEDFAKNVSNASQKLANKATRERRVEITQSSEVKTVEGEESRTKRRIRNINKCRTLNYNYFQLLRKYETRLELYDVKARFSSGKPYWDEDEQAWHYESEEVPLAEAASLLQRALKPDATTRALAAIARILGPGAVDAEGLDVLRADATATRPRLDTIPLAALLAWEAAARDATRHGEPPPARPTAKLPKVLSREERVIATNAVYVESMLGKCSACEDFITDSRVLEIERGQLDTRRVALELERLKLENAHFERDPVHRRVLKLEGLPDGAQVRVYVDADGKPPATHASSTTVEREP